MHILSSKICLDRDIHKIAYKIFWHLHANSAQMPIFLVVPLRRWSVRTV